MSGVIKRGFVVVLLGATLSTAPLVGNAAPPRGVCGAGRLSDGAVLVLCQEMPPFPGSARLIGAGVVAAPGTTPSLISVGCATFKRVNGEGGKRVVGYLSASLTTSKKKGYLIKIVDGLGVEPDSAAVMRVNSLPGGELCDAGSLSPRPLKQGNFVSW